MLPALEKNILKHRALEMALILFQAESLRRFVVDSIKATDHLRIPDGSKKPLQKAWAILVDEGILLRHESDELQELIDYRNDIAHRIHVLTGDITNPYSSQKHLRELQAKYRYDALGKIESYRRKIEDGLRTRFEMSLSLDSVYFEEAEKAYKEELNRLRKKIARQIRIRREKIQKMTEDGNKHAARGTET